MKQSWLRPDWEPGLSISKLPLEHLLQMRIKALLLDVDGTLLHGKEVILHNSVINWIKEAKENLVVHLLSNNPSHKRVGSVAKQLRVDYTCRAGKPFHRGLNKVLKSIELNPAQIGLVGDRIFTDVIAGNSRGLYTVLVTPIGPDGNSCPNNRIQLLEKKAAQFLGAERV